MDKKKLVMIGAGGHAKVCYEIAQLMNKWEKIILLDDNLNNDYFGISGPIKDSNKYLKNSEFFVAIGNNRNRMKIMEELAEKEASITTLIHPNSVVASDVKVNKGSVLMAGVVINSATKIGEGCIINTSVSIDHDNWIGDYVHISPGSHLAGNVHVGENTWVGIGSNIINNVHIGSNITIGGGSVVIDDSYKEGTYLGAPAKINNQQ